MLMNQWENLSDREKQKEIRRVIRKHLPDFCEDFGSYTESEEFKPLFAKFLELTRVYYQTHRHFGAKAIWEVMRWHTYARDNCCAFKCNNNYTASVAQLAKYLFPEELDTFFKTRKGIAA